MVINDFLCHLLEKLGLKKSEKERLQEDITRLEEELRCANDALSDLDEELQDVERRFRKAKALYDDTNGSMKKSREAAVRSLLTDYRHLQERQQVALARRDAVQALLHQRKLELEHRLHSVEIEDLDEAIDIKKDMLYDLRERDKALTELEKNTYQPNESIDKNIAESTDMEVRKERISTEQAVGQMTAHESQTKSEDKLQKTV